MKKVFALKDLDCAACAAKMEDAAAQISGVESVRVDAVTQKLTLSAPDDRFDEIFSQVKAVCAKIEPDCTILTQAEAADKGDAEEGEGWHVVPRIIASAVLFLVGLLLPEGPWKLVAQGLSYAVVGIDVLWRAVRNISRGQIFDENFLMAVASIGAICMGEVAEAAAVMLFYQVGEWFQGRAVDKSRASISSLMDIRPDHADVVTPGGVKTVRPEEVSVGDVILVRPGDRIPLDGVVVEGSSSLNTAALTGESAPRSVTEGDTVLSGCINDTGLLRVRVTGVYAESTVARILKLVEDSGQHKAHAERFITRFAKIYTPAVCGAALLLAVVPSLITGAWVEWITRALTFLVISCPCALVISVPLTFFSGIGSASRKGILIKGADYLELLGNAGVVVFDKTGTLTRGTFEVTAVHPSEGTEEALLEMAALAESWSSHPISTSLRAAWNRAIDKNRVTDVSEIAGRGIKATVDGKTVYAGNSKLMDDVGVSWHDCHKVGTIVHVAADGEYLGHIVISDEVKDGSAEAIRALKTQGVEKTVMLTGDRPEVAQSVADALKVDETHAGLLPQDKVTQVERLLAEKPPKKALCFVGDGINDAPVLRRADLGIAMGALGSDAAIEAADVVLMDDDPRKIATAIRISRKTLSIARQNIIFALGVKAAVLLLGALGIANMWIAVFADVGVSILAILNAMRAMK